MQDEKIIKFLEELEKLMDDEEAIKELEEELKEVETGVKEHEALLQLINSITNVASASALFSIKNELHKLNENISDKLDCDFFQKTLSYVDEKGNMQKDSTDKNTNEKQDVDFSEMIYKIFEGSKSKIEDEVGEKDSLNMEESLSDIMNLLSSLGIIKDKNPSNENVEETSEIKEKFSIENEEEIIDENELEQEESYSRYDMYAETISQYYDYVLGAYDEINRLDVAPTYILYGPIEKSKLPENLKEIVKNNVSVFYNIKNHISNSDEKKCKLSIMDNFVMIDDEKIEKKVEPNAIKTLCIKDNIYFVEEVEEKNNNITTNLHLYVPQKTKKI